VNVMNKKAEKRAGVGPNSRQRPVHRKQDEAKFDPQKEAFKLASGGVPFSDSSGTAYIRFNRDNDGGETYAIDSREFSKAFRLLFYREHGRLLIVVVFEIVRAQLLAEAGSKRDEVFLRVGAAGDTIYLDLCNATREVLEISAGGLKINRFPPINFIRPKTMKALPTPRAKKCTLRVLLKIILPQLNEKGLLIVAVFLVGSLNPSGPYMLLQLVGLQGSGKSTLLKMIKRLLDAAALEGRSLPRTERDLMIAAQHCRVLCFDNVSQLPQWLSDAFCRIATGGGMGTRELFSNGGEVVFDALRPVLINGIGDVIDRPDLKERTLVLNMPEVRKRRTEQEIWKEFDEVCPSILGVLARCVVAVLSPSSLPEPENLPRMADCYLFVRRALPVMGFTPELLDEVMEENRRGASLSVLEASPVAQAVIAYMTTHDELTGTATELWSRLRVKQEYVCELRDWPGDGRALSNELRRVEPELRAVGIYVIHRKSREKRTILIAKTAPASEEEA